ncbi:MAG TPA: hypothetical protein DGG95_15870 [Cytophagales bacterium]|jgi:hypothetical protein|nr:hypothetical protein [Cytophagales bacterium]
MKPWLLLLLLALTELTSAQKFSILGKVVDGDNRSLSYATVTISKKFLRTTTNDQGEFAFQIPVESRNDILSVTMIGFQPFEAPIWSLFQSSGKMAIIKMQPVSLLLDEVVVLDKIKPGEILKISISRIDQNFPTEPFLMEGFYRDLKKLGGTYVSLLEAAVKIQDEDYFAPRDKRKLRERVALQEVRSSLGYSNKFIDFFEKDNLLENLLLNNMIRYRLFPSEDNFFNEVKLEGETTYKNRKAIVLKYQKEFEMRAFIDKLNFGILYIEYTDSRPAEIEKIRGVEGKQVKVKRIIDFSYLEKKLHLNYFKIISQVNWYDIESGKLKFETELERELLIYKIDLNSKKRITLEEKMKSYGLQYQDQSYNQKFWSNFNAIKASPLDKKAIADLEREQPLEKQFQMD